MKKQNSFISSSSSVSTSYSSYYVGEAYDHTEVTKWTTKAKGSPYSIMTQYYDSYNSAQTYSWNTFESTCYEKIEYFLEAVEKLGEPYSKNSYYYQNLTNYSANVATENVYNGFVDLVITMPCDIRLAGIELINPWLSERFDSEYKDYWRYLPTRFNIYKVNTDNMRENDVVKVSYENDIANNTNYNDEKTIRPVKYNKLNNDSNLTLLGTYKDLNWKNMGSYKCFFKYNPNDSVSVNASINSGATGTATWKCKQLVIRIFESKVKLTHLNIYDPSSGTENYTYIKKLIYEYILSKELEYGTTYAGLAPTINQIKQLYNLQEEFSSDVYPEGLEDKNWNFGSKFMRTYYHVKDIKFKSGIDYKLGGIQLLISPDIFSISEMKMYNYAGRDANKVYIGEYDPERNDVIYYGAKNIRQSQNIDITEETQAITWEHNFNVPPTFLQADVYIRFHMKYDTFNVGDVVGNIVNVQNAPLSIKLTNNRVSVSLNNGVGFVNPNTGEFMTFMNGIGVQMDRPGTFDALNAAVDVGAKIIDAGSSVAASITGGCPFQIYFVVKRLF